MPSEPQPGTVLNPYCAGAPEPVVEKFFLLCCFVAGKGALRQQTCLDVFLSLLEEACPVHDTTPFSRLHRFWVQAGRPVPSMGAAAARLADNFPLTEMLKQSRSGQYTRLTRLLCCLLQAWEQQRDMLFTWDQYRFATIPGVGLKTSSFFLINSRPNQHVAVLDTHVLSYMREHNLHPRVPNATPGNPRVYAELEKVWLIHCAEHGMSPQQFDFKVWSDRSQP